MLEFTTQYTRPIKFWPFGGEGFLGCCPMEVVDIMTRDGIHYPAYHMPATNASLRDVIVGLNDNLGDEGYAVPDGIADQIWPLLPAVIDTKQWDEYLSGRTMDEGVFPIQRLANKLGWDLEFRQYDTVRTVIARHSRGPDGFDPDKFFHAAKTAISVFWDDVQVNWLKVNGPDSIATVPVPQADFTPEQIGRLNTWLENVRSDQAVNYVKDRILRDL